MFFHFLSCLLFEVRQILTMQNPEKFCFENKVDPHQLASQSGFPLALEIMENQKKKKFHAWKNHGIRKILNNPGKIMEFCEII